MSTRPIRLCGRALSTHSFVYFLNCCKFLGVSPEVVQCGWSILVDAYLFHIREEYDNAVLAAAAIYLSLHMNHAAVEAKEWWLLFDVKWVVDVSAEN